MAHSGKAIVIHEFTNAVQISVESRFNLPS